MEIMEYILMEEMVVLQQQQQPQHQVMVEQPQLLQLQEIKDMDIMQTILI
jgi:hypothetical protein